MHRMLKGWWMLAKEKVPSLRYQVSPDACTDWDLVCCVPWHLDSAVSGVPVGDAGTQAGGVRVGK